MPIDQIVGSSLGIPSFFIVKLAQLSVVIQGRAGLDSLLS